MNLMRWGFYLIVVMIVSACGDTSTSAPSDEIIENLIAPSGQWSLEYTGACADRASKSLDVTISNEAIVFDNYTLASTGDGDYVGNAVFSMYLESCQRDVLFDYEYSLKQDDEMMFSGVESITEIGFGTETCPIQLVYIGDE